jgi:hypothetical protein
VKLVSITTSAGFDYAQRTGYSTSEGIKYLFPGEPGKRKKQEEMYCAAQNY